MSKHTSGPWYVKGHEVKVCKPEREYLGEGAPETICEMLSSVSPEETRANQVLIAAAPALLQALQHIDANAAESVEWIRRVARAAIAQAEGGDS